MQTVRADKSEGQTVIRRSYPRQLPTPLVHFICPRAIMLAKFSANSANKKTVEPDADAPEGEDKSEDGGLISVDRNSKATLPLTIPRPLQVVYEGSGAGKRRLGFDAGNAAELLSTSPAGRTRLGTGNTSAPLSLRLLRLPAARVSLLLAWILT